MHFVGILSVYVQNMDIFSLVNSMFSHLEVLNGLMMAHIPNLVIILYIKTHDDIDSKE